jgi:hypothetical protein
VSIERMFSNGERRNPDTNLRLLAREKGETARAAARHGE